MDNNLNHRLMTDFIHINNHQNADFPFKYLFDFINSIDANEEFHFIKLTIKVQSCAFQTMCDKNTIISGMKVLKIMKLLFI